MLSKMVLLNTTAPTNSTTNVQKTIRELPQWYLIICTILGVFILISNTIVCLVYWFTPSLRTIGNKLMFSCSISANFVGLFFVPIHLWLDDRTKSASTFVMPISSVLALFFDFATLFNIAALTLERYASIFHALRYDHLMTKRNVRVMLCVVWAVPFVLSVLPSIMAVMINDRGEIYQAFKIYQIVLSSLLLLMLLLIWAIYFKFWRVSRAHLNFDRQQRDHVKLLQSFSMCDTYDTEYSSSEGDTGDKSECNPEKDRQTKKTNSKAKCKNKFVQLFLCQRQSLLRNTTASIPPADELTAGNQCLTEEERASPSQHQDDTQTFRNQQEQKRKSGVYSYGNLIANHKPLERIHQIQGSTLHGTSNNASFNSSNNASFNSSNNASYNPSNNASYDSSNNASYNTSNNASYNTSNNASNVSTPSNNSASARNGSPGVLLQLSTTPEERSNFAQDLTRRLSTLSDNIIEAEIKRKVSAMSQLSITINEQVPDESIYENKPRACKSTKQGAHSPRKLSVVWTPSQNSNLRKFSVPSTFHTNRQPSNNGRRISLSFPVAEIGNNCERFNWPLQSVQSIGTESLTASSTCRNELVDNPSVRNLENSDSEMSFASCFSNFSDHEYVNDGVDDDNIDCDDELEHITGMGTPELIRSATSQSKVSFALVPTPPTPRNPCEVGPDVQIKSIMRHPNVSPQDSHDDKRDYLQRSRTESNEKKKKLQAERHLKLKKTFSLPLKDSPSNEQRTPDTVTPFDFRQQSKVTSSDRPSSTSPNVSTASSGYCTGVKDSEHFRCESASIKRARYKCFKDQSFESSKDEERDSRLDNCKARKKIFSKSSSNVNPSISIDSRSNSAMSKRSSSIPLSFSSSRLTKPRNSYASVILYAKEFLIEMRHTRIIACIFLTNALCWIPLIFLNLADATGKRYLITQPLLMTSQSMFLLNALVIPFVYAFCKREFKMAIKRHMRRIGYHCCTND